MNINHKKAAWTVVAAALVAAFATGAQAEDILQVHVKYADLNVNNPVGAAVLYRRIHAAAEKVCAVPGGREWDRTAQAKACVAKATANAVAAVNAPALTGLHEVHGGGATQLATIR